MVAAIEFAVRSAAGGTQHGSVAGDAQGNFIQVGAGDAVSLNLGRESIIGYEQQGSDLLVKLSDGRTVVLSNYFDGSGTPHHLYLSADGEISEVILNQQDGVLFADYGPAQGWDKWSPLDDLRFTSADAVEEVMVASTEPAGMAPLVPGLLGGFGGLGAAAAAAGGLALLGATGGGSGGGQGGTIVKPTVDPKPVDTLTTNTDKPQVTITGTGPAGNTVEVDLGGKKETTTIGTDGKWSVTFPSTNLPKDGEYTAKVVVTTPAGGKTDLTGPGVIIDMTPPPVTLVQGVKSTNDVENLAEHADGVTVKGTGEAGAKIEVKVGEFTQTTTVAGNGTWTVTFPTTQVPGGEYETPVKITSTDIHGNKTVVNDVLVIDTVPHPITFNAVTADNTVNMAESAIGLVVTGTSTAGATISVTLQGVTQTATVGSNGVWSVTYPTGTLPGGEYAATLTATTTDAAGNVSTSYHAFNVDTVTSVAFTGSVAGDNVVNAAEAAGGITLTGTAQAGSTVSVAWNGTTLPATVAANGSWSVVFPASAVTAGTYSSTATVTATDAAGNSASASRTIAVDTQMSVAVDASQSGTDNTISGGERVAGVALTGTAEAGATVAVTFEGVTKTVTAGSNGVWSASYSTSEIRSGTYNSTVSVRATDAAGNVATASHSVKVDTEVTPLTRATMTTGTDDVVNFVEARAGVTVTGTVEAGSTVMVKFGTSAARAATVDANGNWSIVIPNGDIPAGESNATMVVSATDRVGNTASISETVKIDTTVRNFASNAATVSGDGYVNAAEAAQGLSFSGTGEPGNTIVLKLSNGSEMNATVGANGSWTATFPTSMVPSGDNQNASVTIKATDRAGNVSEITQNFVVDTVAPDSPDVTYVGKTTTGAMRVLHTEETPDVYSFHEVTSSGTSAAVGATRTHDNGWNEAVFAFNRPVPDGSYLVINTKDAAGNEASTLLVVDNTSSPVVDLSRSSLSNFDFSTIDLSVAPDAQLSITATQLQQLTGPDQRLIIKGDDQDMVTVVNGVDTNTTRTIDGDTYRIFTLGSTGGQVLVDDDITTRTGI